MADNIQIVQPPDAAARRATRLGIGLLVSLVVGWPALARALDGHHFEASVLRFLASVAASVGAVLVLGWLYDTFTAAPAPSHAPPAARGPLDEVDR